MQNLVLWTRSEAMALPWEFKGETKAWPSGSGFFTWAADRKNYRLQRLRIDASGNVTEPARSPTLDPGRPW